MSSPQGLGGLLTAGGGISPMQQALAQYLGREDMLKQEQDFTAPSGGPAMSTMATQAFAGSQAKGIKEAVDQSQADQAAQASSINQQAGSAASGLGTLLAKGGGGGGSGG